MTKSSRRKARRIREARRAAAYARVAARRQQIAEGTRQGPRIWTRKDREAAQVGLGLSTKQQRKHQARKTAHRLRALEVRRAAQESQLRDRLGQAPVELVSLDFLGSMFPLVGHGRVRTSDGRVLLWSFRFRYDRAFLEVGIPAGEDGDLVSECVLFASRDDVTGDAYCGHLPAAQLMNVLAELFESLAPPQPGARFGERLQNTVALAVGNGGDPDAPTLIR